VKKCRIQQNASRTRSLGANTRGIRKWEQNWKVDIVKYKQKDKAKNVKLIKIKLKKIKIMKLN